MSSLLEEKLGGKQGENRNVKRTMLDKKTKTERFSELERAVFDEKTFEKECDDAEILKIRTFEDRKRRKAVIGKVSRVLLVILILYTAFLTYGVIITDYIYDDRGNAVPLVLSVSDIQKKQDFQDFSAFYYSIRELYEETISLDQRLFSSDDSVDYISLSSEYDKLLDDVSYIVIQLEAYSPSSEYRQTYDLMTELIKTDIAVYLQNISAATAKNDEERWQKAMIDRETIYRTFCKVTENLLSLGDNVKDISLSDISEWDISVIRGIIERNSNVQQQ